MSVDSNNNNYNNIKPKILKLWDITNVDLPQLVSKKMFWNIHILFYMNGKFQEDFSSYQLYYIYTIILHTTINKC